MKIETQFQIVDAYGGVAGCLWAHEIVADPGPAFPDCVKAYRNKRWVASAWYGVRAEDKTGKFVPYQPTIKPDTRTSDPNPASQPNSNTKEK